MKKPIIRWTAGKMSEEGCDCLIHSVKKWDEIYGDKFEKFICYKDKIPKRISSLHVNFLNQSNYTKNIPYYPHDTFWKFCPPRIDINTHEIIIDNDVVIYNKIPHIDDFIKSNHILSSAGHRKFYGQFDEILKNVPNINTGLIGFPPNFNFENALKKISYLYPFLSMKEHCDDQGVFMCVSKKNIKIIPMCDLYVCNPTMKFAPYKKGKYGTHFAGINQNKTDYWNKYIKETKHEK